MLKTKTLDKTVTTVLILLLTLTILNVAINVNIQPAHATAIQVSPGDVIQTKINGASSGDVLNFSAGTYTEDFTINKTLELVAVQGEAVKLKGVSSTTSGAIPENIKILADGVEIHGFTIESPTYAANAYSGGIVLNGTDIEMYNNTFVAKGAATGNFYVIQTYGAGVLSPGVGNENITGLNVHNNTFTSDVDCQYVGVYVNPTLDEKTIYVANNTFSGKICQGIVTEYNNTIIQGNELVTDLAPTVYGVGIAMWRVYDITTWTPETTNNCNVSDIQITGNTVKGSGATAGFMYGVQIGTVTGMENVTVTNNQITMNKRGIRVKLASGLRIEHNNIYDNTEYGVTWATGITPDADINATLNYWGSATGPGYTGGVGGLGTGDKISDNVRYIPWLNAAYPGGVSTTPFSVTPTSTKGSVQKWFNITVQNIGSPAAVDYVNVTYPSSFTLHTYNYPTGWTQSHDISGETVTFTATGGYQLDTSESGRFDFQMTTSASSDDFKILCRNLMGGKGYQNLTISVDATAPTPLAITKPAANDMVYSVGSGNKMWINGTIKDETYATPSVAINDTRFSLQVGPTYNASAADYTWYFGFSNASAVPDGALAVNVTGEDAAGNPATPAIRSATVDNTAPTLISLVVMDDKIGNLTSVGSTFYMSGDAAGLNFTVTFTEAHPYTNVTYIYNGTGTTTKSFKNNTWFYTNSPWYNVTGINTITIYNITITDAAQPTRNRLVTGSYTIVRDQQGPTVPTYTVTEICGGLVIKNLNSTDNVGVQKYEVYVNSTKFLEVTPTQLASTTLAWVAGALNASCVFDGTLVLNLTNYAGGHANLTIRAVDIGGNSGNFSTPTVYTIAEGQWYPIELQTNWNLLGLPLIPASTARADVLSLMLKQGAAGVRFVYGYNNNTDAWVLNPTTMEDGIGYWINMKAYDVLIVSGRISAPPPALPPNYYLTAGWVLAGYKCTSSMNVTTYLSSLPSGSYFTYVYVWNAQTQNWMMKSAGDNLDPGMGIWIWMYSNQTLIPPIP